MMLVVDQVSEEEIMHRALVTEKIMNRALITVASFAVVFAIVCGAI